VRGHCFCPRSLAEVAQPLHTMCPAGRLASPPLRHSSSEALLPRQGAGSGVLGQLPGLKCCSSAASCGMQTLDSPCSRKRNHFGASRSTLEVLSSLQDRCESSSNVAPRALAASTGSGISALPPLVESGRGMASSPSSSPGRLRPAKRSRSSTGGVTLPTLPSIAEVDNSAKSKSWSQPPLPRLSASQSTGALVSSSKSNAALVDSDLEQVLVTALNGSSNRQSVHKAPIDNCRAAMEMEACLQALMDLPEDKENLSPKKKGKKDRRAGMPDHHSGNDNRTGRKGAHPKIIDHHGDNENNLHRKGTGFVHLNSSLEEVTACRAKIVDHHGDNENNIRRKGTGYIHLTGSPLTDKHARILDSHGDNESNIRRRGTGFVHLSSLPTDAPAVCFPDMDGGGVNNIHRKGTGYIFLNHLSPRVRIADSHGDNENSIQRKGTGFIDLSKCDLSTCSDSCSDGTSDSPGACKTVNVTDLASHKYLREDEQVSLIDTL